MPEHVGRFLIEIGSSPGVLWANQYTPIADVIGSLVLVWAATEAEEWRNRFVQIAL